MHGGLLNITLRLSGWNVREIQTRKKFIFTAIYRTGGQCGRCRNVPFAGAAHINVKLHFFIKELHNYYEIKSIED